MYMCRCMCEKGGDREREINIIIADQNIIIDYNRDGKYLVNMNENECNEIYYR